MKEHSLVNTLLVVGNSLEPKYSEDVNGGKGGSEDSDAAHEESITLTIVLHGVVGGKGDK